MQLLVYTAPPFILRKMAKRVTDTSIFAAVISIAITHGVYVNLAFTLPPTLWQLAYGIWRYTARIDLKDVCVAQLQ